MTMEDPQPQKQLENNKKKKKRKKKINNANDENKPKEAIQKKIKSRKKIKKEKKNGNNNKIDAAFKDGNSDIFVFDEIANNKEASALISALVKCYTCNCTLPQSELDTLNKNLFEKTVSVFLNILNNCINKIYNKLLKTIHLKNFAVKKVAKKDAFCQTYISYDNQHD